MGDKLKLRPLKIGEVFWAWHTGTPRRARLVRKVRDSEFVRVLLFDPGEYETLHRADCYGEDEIPRLVADLEQEIRDLKGFRLFVLVERG